MCIGTVHKSLVQASAQNFYQQAKANGFNYDSVNPQSFPQTESYNAAYLQQQSFNSFKGTNPSVNIGYGWEAQESKPAFYDNSGETAKCETATFQNKWVEDKVGGSGKIWDEENHSEASTVASPCPESCPQVWNVESGVRQAQAPAVSVDKKAVVVDRNLETGSPYRRHTSELLRRIDILLVQNSPPSNGSSGKRKKSRASAGINKPRARNVVLKQLVDLLRKIQRDDQAISFVAAESKPLMNGFRSATRHSTSAFDNTSMVRPRDAAEVMRRGVRDVQRPPVVGLSAPPPAAPPPCDIKLPPSASMDGWMGWNWSHHSEPAGFVGAEAGPAGPTGPAMPATFWAGHNSCNNSAGMHGPVAEEEEEVAGAEVLDLLALLRGGAAGYNTAAMQHAIQQQVAAGCFQHWD